MLRLYNTAMLPLRLAVGLWAVWQSLDPARRIEWAERRARRLPTVTAGGAWIHGASVGEAGIVSALTRALRVRRPELPLSVSVHTRTGRKQLPEPPAVDAAFFVPLDFPGHTRRLLAALKPAVLGLVETEIWPNMLVEADRLGIPVLLLNGRLSESRMTRYRRFAGLYRPLLQRIRGFGVQTDEDAARFVELGARDGSVVITGSIKYDLPPPATGADELRQHLGLARNRSVFVAGSTGSGEETHVLRAFLAARRSDPDLLLVLAPRHPSRTDEVEALLRARGLVFRRYSAPPVNPDRSDVVLVDTVGTLAALYQLAHVAFVGGSLIPLGGHNVLEPAAVGVPVLFGPHTESVAGPAAALVREGGARIADDGDDLGRHLTELLTDPVLRDRMGGNARRVVQANRGALERTVTLMLETLG